MKFGIILIILTIGLLLSACGNDTAEQNETVTPTQEVAEQPEQIPEEIVVEEAEPKEETPITPPTPTTKLPEEFNVILTDVEILRTTYTDDEEYELRMILSQEEANKIIGAVLKFTPLCDKESTMFITTNEKTTMRTEPPCGEAQEIVIPANNFVEGPNSVIFQNEVEEDYELADIALVFSYAGGGEETLDANNHVFEQDTNEKKMVKDLGVAVMTNVEVRTFSLSETNLQHDLYLSFDTSERDGALIIQLNGKTIFDGVPKTNGHEFLLPYEDLRVGKNTLMFYGTE